METCSKNWWIMMFEGLALLILGVMCLAIPFAVTMAFPVILSIILVVGGIIQLFRSFALRKEMKIFMISLFSSFLAIIAGIFMYRYQAQSILLVSAMMIAYLCFDGISRMFFSSNFHYTKSWPLVMISGFLSLGLGLFLMMSLPVSSFYTIGLLLGVSMLVFGISLLIMSIEVKKCRPVEIL